MRYAFGDKQPEASNQKPVFGDLSMSVKINDALTRRSFMKLSGAAAALAATSGPSRVLHALVAQKEGTGENQIRDVFSACDMCFNKCGLIARVENDVVKKLDPNPKSLKS